MLGKPAMADMSLGLATAPILYAAENAPEIKKIVKRRFKKEVRASDDGQTDATGIMSTIVHKGLR